MIETEEISESEVNNILDNEEDHFLDHKSKHISPAKLSETISSFANANGGELYIGIGEDSNDEFYWDGFENPEEANGHLHLFEELFPMGKYFSYQFLQSEDQDGLVLHVEVNKTSSIKESSDGTIYKRVGAQNKPLKSDDQIRRLRLDKGIDSFEDETLDIEMDLITNSYTINDFMIEVIPSLNPDKWLRKQRLLIDDKPTIAGVLLFAEYPQGILPKSAIKIYRYKTTDHEGKRDNLAFDPKSVEGNLYNQINKTTDLVSDIIEDVRKMGPDGLEEVTYPEETLHEVITNAVIHRDYSINKDVQIRIFDNRVEVESPGLLPGYVTPENILSEQFSRNHKIVRLLNKFPNPPNKDVGEGLNTAFQAMEDLRLEEPDISELDNSVLVDIRHEPLASPEEAILDYLEDHDEIQNKDARKLTGIDSENSIKNHFYNLRDQNLIERVPDKKGPASAWQKVDD